MAQFKLYGNQSFLQDSPLANSAPIHRASVEALGRPEARRFHRFFPLDLWQVLHPADRSSRTVFIEVMMFAGRSFETRKALYTSLLQTPHDDCGINAGDIELTLVETPRHDWLMRGRAGGEPRRNYNLNHVADAPV